MAISYKKLWKLLIDKDIKKKDLVQMAGLSSYTLNKLNKSENVNADTLMKICVALDCTFDDIMEIVPEPSKSLIRCSIIMTISLNYTCNNNTGGTEGQSDGRTA